MTNFGLVVLGAHIGIHIKGEIEKILPEKVLLVEPVPHNVVEIKKNLNNLEGITIEQVALSDKNEKRNFYFVKNTSIHKLKKHWSSGIGSFNKQHLLDHKSKRFKIEEEDIDKISIQAIRFKDLVDELRLIIDENNIKGIIVGNPLNMDGSSGRSAQSVKDTTENIEKNLDIPICLWDERLSTVGAFNLSSQLDINVSKREKKIDENAAAFILQGALDFLNN